jgi:hypothetical protein
LQFVGLAGAAGHEAGVGIFVPRERAGARVQGLDQGVVEMKFARGRVPRTSGRNLAHAAARVREQGQAAHEKPIVKPSALPNHKTTSHGSSQRPPLVCLHRTLVRTLKHG